jgi:hypothetical protein
LGIARPFADFVLEIEQRAQAERRRREEDSAAGPAVE